MDIILRSKGESLSEEYKIVADAKAVDSAGPQEFVWVDPSAVFTDEELASAETFQDKNFQLELFDAVGGGLICRLGWLAVVVVDCCASRFVCRRIDRYCWRLDK